MNENYSQRVEISSEKGVKRLSELKTASFPPARHI